LYDQGSANYVVKKEEKRLSRVEVAARRPQSVVTLQEKPFDYEPHEERSALRSGRIWLELQGAGWRGEEAAGSGHAESVTYKRDLQDGRCGRSRKRRLILGWIGSILSGEH